uniref:Olfactory receptor family 10 subfamily AG member 1 n=1 Tax=Balaenoptera musculus TaxID=9771 RepID=A0A8C0I7D8_BALMU
MIMRQKENLTGLMEFLLLDFADVPHLQWFLFGLSLVTGIIMLMGNNTIILITKVGLDPQIPMYSFLGNFSLLEITMDSMLINLWTQKRHISLSACATQMSCALINYVFSQSHIQFTNLLEI